MVLATVAVAVAHLLQVREAQEALAHEVRAVVVEAHHKMA
jgi:hypothetical protein